MKAVLVCRWGHQTIVYVIHITTLLALLICIGYCGDITLATDIAQPISQLAGTLGASFGGTGALQASSLETPISPALANGIGVSGIDGASGLVPQITSLPLDQATLEQARVLPPAASKASTIQTEDLTLGEERKTEISPKGITTQQQLSGPQVLSKAQTQSQRSDTVLQHPTGGGESTIPGPNTRTLPGDTNPHTSITTTAKTSKQAEVVDQNTPSDAMQQQTSNPPGGRPSGGGQSQQTSPLPTVSQRAPGNTQQQPQAAGHVSQPQVQQGLTSAQTGGTPQTVGGVSHEAKGPAITLPTAPNTPQGQQPAQQSQISEQGKLPAANRPIPTQTAAGVTQPKGTKPTGAGSTTVQGAQKGDPKKDVTPPTAGSTTITNGKTTQTKGDITPLGPRKDEQQPKPDITLSGNPQPDEGTTPPKKPTPKETAKKPDTITDINDNNNITIPKIAVNETIISATVVPSAIPVVLVCSMVFLYLSRR